MKTTLRQSLETAGSFAAEIAGNSPLWGSLRETLRKFAVKEGRAMVRVRHRVSRDPATIGVCPSCFNLKKRREVLLIQLAKMGYEVAYRADMLDGTYRTGKTHAPGCRFRHLPVDSWDEFTSVIKRLK